MQIPRMEAQNLMESLLHEKLIVLIFKQNNYNK